ncbi:MAG: cupin domain-containing protein [Pseudomonadota bacterium]
MTRRASLGALAGLSATAMTGAAAAEGGAESTNPAGAARSGQPSSTDQGYTYVPPRGGTNYDWGSDHLFVKVSADDTNGAYTLIEDNLASSFALGLHVHREHAETFYMLDGSVDFFIANEWITVETGGTLHIPPGIPHAAMMTPGVARARMTMVFQPGGFDRFLAELDAMSAADRADKAKMKALNERYDFIPLGPVPKRT